VLKAVFCFVSDAQRRQFGAVGVNDEDIARRSIKAAKREEVHLVSQDREAL
jgi:hypothetical protein